MVTPITWLRLSVALASLGAIGIVLVHGGDLVALVVVASVLAYLLFPLVNALERRGLNRTVAVVVVFLGFSSMLAATGWLLFPILVAELSAWQGELGSGRLFELLDRLEADLSSHLPFVEPGTLNLSESAHEALQRQQSQLLGYATNALSLLGNLVVVPFVLFFLLRDGARIIKEAVGFVPNAYFEFTMGVLFKIDAHLGGYLRGQSLVALCVALATILGLGLVGVDYYVILGTVAGFANFIPYVGLLISGGLALVVSVLSTGGMGQILGILLVFAAVQSLENVVLQPAITARVVRLHPVSVLLAILIGGRLAGVLGMALAVPTVAVAKVIIVETAVTLRRYRL